MVWWMECRGGDIKEGGKTQTKALRLFLDSDPGTLISNFRLHHLHLKIAQIACGEAGSAPRWTGANYGNITFDHILFSGILILPSRVKQWMRNQIHQKQFSFCMQRVPHSNRTVRARRHREASMRSRYKYSCAILCREKGKEQAWYRVAANPEDPH